MRIREWEDLGVRDRAWVALLDWSDGDPPSVAGRVAAERATPTYRSYRPLFAFIGGQLAGRVGTLALNLRTEEGDAPVLGICDVVTAPTFLGRGIARGLLEEVHRRYSSRGAGFFLWTRRSWGAHRLYERLGYRDIYSPEVLVRRVPARRAPRRRRAVLSRVARRADAPMLERLLDRSTRGRIGLLPRPRGSFEARFRLGFRRPQDYHVLEREGEPIGYVWARRDEHQVMAEEIVAAERADQGRILGELEDGAAGRWLAITSTSFVRDQADRLHARRYLRFDESHRVLMFRGPGPRSTRGIARVRAIFRDPRLSLHEGDRF